MEVIFMTRRKDSLQKAAMRGLVREYLKNNDISTKNDTDVNTYHARHQGFRIIKSRKPFQGNLPVYCKAVAYDKEASSLLSQHQKNQ